jgi:hypothetical protein
MDNKEYLLEGLEETMEFSKELGVKFRTYFREIYIMHKNISNNNEIVLKKLIIPILKENDIEKLKYLLALLGDGYIRFTVWSSLITLAEKQNVVLDFNNLKIDDIKDPEALLELSDDDLTLLDTYKQVSLKLKAELNQMDKELWEEFVVPVLGENEKLDKLISFMPECPARFNAFQELSNER